MVLEYIYFNGFLLWICIPLSFFLILLAFLSVSVSHLSLSHSLPILSFSHYSLFLHPIFRSFVIRINWIALQWYKQWVSGCEGFFSGSAAAFNRVIVKCIWNRTCFLLKSDTRIFIHTDTMRTRTQPRIFFFQFIAKRSSLYILLLIATDTL